MKRRGKQWTFEDLIRKQKEREEKMAMEKAKGPEYVYVVSERIDFDKNEDGGKRASYSKAAYRTCEEVFQYILNMLGSDTGKGAEWIFDFDNNHGQGAERVTLVGKGRWPWPGDDDLGELENGTCTIEIDRIWMNKKYRRDLE